MTAVVTGGYVTFRVGERVLAAPLVEVREVLRLEGLDALPGMEAPLAGVMHVRGVPLPVLDVRRGGGRGDVLVVLRDGSPCGIAVDAVVAVRAESELAAVEGGLPPGLPAYVTAVLHDGGRPVLLVDLDALVRLLGGPAHPQT